MKIEGEIIVEVQAPELTPAARSPDSGVPLKPDIDVNAMPGSG